jgi:hypothetical protein
MTPTQPSCPYRDFAVSDQLGYSQSEIRADKISLLPGVEISPDHLGYPELCNLPNGSLLVSTWSGYCFEVDPAFGLVAVQPKIGLEPGRMSSPAATTTQPAICSAATHVLSTKLWQLGAPRTLGVKTDGPVNSVALSPQGDLLATGLGMYPLNPDRHPNAAIELFSTADPSEPLSQRVLPGVAVDRVGFHPTRGLLVAVTGARSQDRGHVVLLDHRTLDLLDVTETDLFSCRAAIVDADSDRLILAYRDGIQVRSLDQLWNVEWEWRAEADLLGAAHDAERDWIFLSNGQVLSPGVGEVARLPALDKCTGLAILRDGRLAAISRPGVLRVWETGFGWEPS